MTALTTLSRWRMSTGHLTLLKQVIITLTESDEATDMADEFEDDMICYTSTCIVQK